MTKRRILYLDVDAFFASVEEIFNPSLKGKLLIVGARREHRGVVASVSYAAQAFGVRPAMPTAQALRLCPQAIVVPTGLETMINKGAVKYIQLRRNRWSPCGLVTCYKRESRKTLFLRLGRGPGPCAPDRRASE